MKCRRTRIQPQSSNPSCRGFTLIELLTVIAIISLLIAILLPALSKARQQARDVATRGAMKAIGGGVEMFRSDNQSDFRTTDGIPPSSAGEDQATSGQQFLFGAQWLVRYLLGKDLQGYAPRRNVPANLVKDTDDGYMEQDWYSYDSEGNPVVDRVGPYLSSDALRLSQLTEIPGYEDISGNGYPLRTDADSMRQPVVLDAYGYPILYYAGNARQARKARALVAGYDPECLDCAVGVFSYADNGLLTGQCEGGSGEGGTCKYQSWDFGSGEHYITHFGHDFKLGDPYDQYVDYFVTTSDRRTFQYYLMNKNLFKSTYDSGNYDSSNASTWPTVQAYRKDSYLLISAGFDGIYGSDDDVTNFD